MRGGVAVAALMLAGCASGVPVERQVVVSGAHFAAVQGEASLLVRTFLPEEAGERSEVIGATCAVVTSLYSTELVTPSRLVVPNFGPQSPEIGVDCTAGDLVGSGSAKIVTRWQDSPGTWGYPWGPGIYAPYGWRGYGYGYGYGYGAGYPVSDYADLAVILRPRGATAP